MDWWFQHKNIFRWIFVNILRFYVKTYHVTQTCTRSQYDFKTWVQLKTKPVVKVFHQTWCNHDTSLAVSDKCSNCIRYLAGTLN